ncbi:MAG: trypsin-like peptidase domain-containing protein [Solirubrobacterales bacterium]|nr:trypsin-like peptidase domain-containing protein [Solirubrobacterales bacterium]
MRRLAAAAALAALLGGAAACGDDGDTKTVARTTSVEVVPPPSSDDGGGDQPAGFDPRAIYERESPGVVTVLSAGFGGDPSAGGLGSGFVVSGDGEIATNAHVVTQGEGRSIREAGKVYVRFPDGNQVQAEVKGFDPFSDVALLKVDPAGLRLRPLPLGTAGSAQVGEPVAAIGSPFGEEQSLTTGVVSATGRSIESLTGFQTSGAIQTDASINSGNSGGPLLDAQGRVLGINSQIRTRSGESSGVGFAVPVDVVKRSLDQLRRDGKVRYGYLGVSTKAVYPQLADEFDLGTDKGAWVQEVVRGGPADDAGLRAGGDQRRFQEDTWLVGGDVIVAVDGRELQRDTDLGVELLRHLPGTTVKLTIVRDGRRKEVPVKLGTRPLESPQG